MDCNTASGDLRAVLAVPLRFRKRMLLPVVYVADANTVCLLMEILTQATVRPYIGRDESSSITMLKHRI